MKNSLWILNNFLNRNVFKASYVLIIILAIFAAIINISNGITNRVFNDMVIVCTNPWVISIIFGIIGINTYYFLNAFLLNSSYAIRWKDKGTYSNNVFKIIVLFNATVFCFIVITFIAVLLIFGSKVGLLEKNFFYNIPAIIYLVFYLIKFLAFIILFNYLLFVFYKYINNIFSLIVYMFCSLWVHFHNYTTGGVISTIREMKLLFPEYLSLQKYYSFIFEVIICLLYIVLLLIIIKLFEFIIIKIRRNKYEI